MTTRNIAARVSGAGIGWRLKVVVAENHTHAAKVIAHAEAAFGTIPPDLLRQAQRLRWLQAPQAAPPAGYYYPELIAHPVAITNFREIYNDRIGAHVMAFVLAFARGLHHYIPQQLKREWKKLPPDTGVVHLPERRRWSSASTSAAATSRPGSPSSIAETNSTLCCRPPISSS